MRQDASAVEHAIDEHQLEAVNLIEQGPHHQTPASSQTPAAWVSVSGEGVFSVLVTTLRKPAVAAA